MSKLSEKEITDYFLNACERGNLDMVSYIVKTTYIKANNEAVFPLINLSIANNGVEIACREGHLPLIQYFLSSPELKNILNIHNVSQVALKVAFLYQRENIIN